MTNLKGKVAVVTGGSGGIGGSIAFHLGMCGVKVVVHYSSNEANAKKIVKAINAQDGIATDLQFDVCDSKAVQNGFEEIMNDFGKIDILVCCAGITKDGPFIRMKDNAWDKVLNVNLTGTKNCIQAALKPMLKQKSGTIIAISSIVGLAGNAMQANYATSKAGQIALIKSVAKEYASRDIRAFAIAPGFIKTEMTSDLPDEIREKALADTPLGRFGNSDDVAKVAVFLCSDGASFMTGNVINVDGGMYV